MVSVFRSQLGLASILALLCLAMAVAPAIATKRHVTSHGVKRAAVSAKLRTHFAAWMAKHGHAFHGAELEHRLAIFSSNMAHVKRVNKRKLGFKLGPNKFAHLTFKEFKKHYLGLKLHSHGRHGKLIRGPRPAANFTAPLNADVPDSVDWRDSGVVTDVKDQGHCGSCWSFSVTGAIESAVAIQTGNLVPLSEQQLVDCDSSDNGCYGGAPANAFNYVQSTGGLASEDDYPYSSGATQSSGTCTQANLNSPITGFSTISPDAGSLQAALAQQPVSVSVSVSRAFQLYTSGVFWGMCDSSGQNLNHAVLAVGYGTGGGLLGLEDFWIVKNSWGPNWGEGGYIRLRRNLLLGNSVCGIAANALVPTV